MKKKEIKFCMQEIDELYKTWFIEYSYLCD